jgi:glycosyltransferase involved in cell wall biosynthesis
MSSPNPNLPTHSGPLVSVSMTAFNSEHWLPRAIDSAINQQTDFPIEIVIADDCSTDSTLRVAHSYRERYPNVIRVLERSKNIGIQRNYYETFEQCRGKYIAWLDSDDFWTDPEKLAIQVRTLESDPSLKVCGHFVRWVSTDGEIKRDRYPSIAPGRYGLAEIIHHNFLPSLSVMFRNGIHRNLPTWYFDLAPTTDWPIFVLAALAGDIVLLDRVMADYTLAPESSLTSKGDLFWYTKDARFYEKIESILPSTWQRLARAEKGKRYESMAYLLRKQGDFVASREAAFKAFCSPSLVDNSGSKTKSLLAAVIREAQWRLRGKPTAEAK